ncbi:hypothetical protein MNBD_GAMMA04-2154 [hydrothermal vent metagenome]|uniref:Uncharacterized protein n=1 Tax=hydrothermal vent metagenome TaxID=652676 RepID=A0A3B0W051_9ZZZZ
MSANPEFIEYVRELLMPLGELKDGLNSSHKCITD